MLVIRSVASIVIVIDTWTRVRGGGRIGVLFPNASVGGGWRTAAACARARGLSCGRVGDVYARPRVLRRGSMSKVYACTQVLGWGRRTSATCWIDVLLMNTSQGTNEADRSRRG